MLINKYNKSVLVQLITLSIMLISCDNSDSNFEADHKIEWQHFNQSSFDQAKKNDKLVFLEVGANWCHWCHVMDDSTYSDRQVQNYLEENFILCREDQDARPDLYAAYKPWGWPALIVLNDNGDELLRLRGFQEKNEFLNDLKKVRKNPIPLPNRNAVEKNQLEVNEAILFNQFIANIDYKKGGYNWSTKSLESQGIIHALQFYNQNDTLKKWVDLTIKNSYQLIDPVWGGAYQYSARKSWNYGHFEKILRVQADYIKAYSIYAVRANKPEALSHALEILNYCNRFLGNETPLYWNSQNADLISGVHSGEYYDLNESERLAQGTPSVDQRIYLKENAAMCIGLGYLWAATGDEVYLLEGLKMLNYMLAEFKDSSGLYVREVGVSNLFSFEDNRTLLDALIQYYQITRDNKYLQKAVSLGSEIMTAFDSDNGIKSAVGELAIAPIIVPRNNISAVSTFNLLYHISEKDTFKTFASKTYALLDKKRLSQSQTTLPLSFKAGGELKEDPFHAVFITDGQQNKLKSEYLQSLLLSPSSYFVFDELKIGEMSHEDEQFYGGFDPGTLFMCTASFCSAPITSQLDLANFLRDQE